jgi:ribose transport system permease protein
VFSRRGRVYSRLKGIIGLLAVVVIALLASPHSPRGGLVFLEPGNISDILRQVSEIGILSLGMTFVILIEGIDLSVGTVLAFASSLVALMLMRNTFGLPQFLAIALATVAALLASGLVGLANGLVIARWKIQPFIVTLATMIGIRGLARWLTSNTNIDIGFGTDTASVFASSLSTKTVVIGSYVVLAVALAALLSNTVFGRYVRAVGDNETAAQYAGLPITRMKILVYTMAGLLAGYSGILHAAQNHQGNPSAGVAYELEAIAAAVIGGTLRRNRFTRSSMNLPPGAKGVILVSSELAELWRCCNRILVLREGRQAGIVTTADSSQEEVLRLATGTPV